MESIDQIGIIDQATNQFESYIEEADKAYGKNPSVSSYIGKVTLLNTQLLSNINIGSHDWYEEPWNKDDSIASSKV